MSSDPHSGTQPPPAASLGDLPLDELARYGHELGLEIPRDAAAGECARLIRQRQELLVELDRAALIDIVVWSRRPVRASAGKEELAREIAKIQRTNYHALSTPGLIAYARLRGVRASKFENAEDIIEQLRKQDGLGKRIGALRRSLVGSFLSRVFDQDAKSEDAEYRFLPDDATGAEVTRQSLKEQVEAHGLVGGIASRLRGAADDYIRVKLDEIETRLDAKLDQIDKRLAEWRDREIANRLKILRITLIFTVVVAVLSLGYNYVKSRVEKGGASAPTATAPAEGIRLDRP
jgi:hypothetical protein